MYRICDAMRTIGGPRLILHDRAAGAVRWSAACVVCCCCLLVVGRARLGGTRSETRTHTRARSDAHDTTICTGGTLKEPEIMTSNKRRVGARLMCVCVCVCCVCYCVCVCFLRLLQITHIQSRATTNKFISKRAHFMQTSTRINLCIIKRRSCSHGTKKKHVCSQSTTNCGLCRAERV